jgi:1-acyl-sn-glycerol-3-phosphate acyltransferase
MVKKILAYPLSVLFYMVFGLILITFHPIQIICFRIFGYESHRKSVMLLNLLIIKSLSIVGSRISFKGFEKLPKGRPLIIVSNHQSTWDISPIAWGFRNHHAKFVSKSSLARGIPSISYNLRHGGSILINRKNGQQAIKELLKLGKRIEKDNYSACIFPEGTRSKDGVVKKFQSGGIRTLLKAAPSALIVPFVIDGNYKLQPKGVFPFSIGNQLIYTVLDPIEPGKIDPDILVLEVENLIRKELNQISENDLVSDYNP